MPAASPEDTLPFLLDEDPSRGSSKHGSQGGSSAQGRMAMPLPQLQQPAQQLQPSLQQLQDQQVLVQQRRAWSVDPQQAMQVYLCSARFPILYQFHALWIHVRILTCCPLQEQFILPWCSALSVSSDNIS